MFIFCHIICHNCLVKFSPSSLDIFASTDCGLRLCPLLSHGGPLLGTTHPLIINGERTLWNAGKQKWVHYTLSVPTFNAPRPHSGLIYRHLLGRGYLRISGRSHVSCNRAPCAWGPAGCGPPGACLLVCVLDSIFFLFPLGRRSALPDCLDSSFFSTRA